MVTFMRIGEASVVWREVLQRQAVIKLTGGGTVLHLSRIVLGYNGKIGEGKGRTERRILRLLLDFPFVVFSSIPGFL